MGLREQLFGKERGDEFQVRYTGFRDREPSSERSPATPRSTPQRGVGGPSGHLYTFRGRRDGTSQWLTVRKGDKAFFESMEDFELKKA